MSDLLSVPWKPEYTAVTDIPPGKQMAFVGFSGMVGKYTFRLHVRHTANLLHFHLPFDTWDKVERFFNVSVEEKNYNYKRSFREHRFECEITDSGANLDPTKEAIVIPAPHVVPYACLSRDNLASFIRYVVGEIEWGFLKADGRGGFCEKCKLYDRYASRNKIGQVVCYRCFDR